MNGNHERQKFQAQEWVQKMMRKAAAYRQAKQENGNRPALALSIKMLIPVAVGLFLAIWLLIGCARSAVALAMQRDESTCRQPATAIVESCRRPLLSAPLADFVPVATVDGTLLLDILPFGCSAIVHTGDKDHLQDMLFFTFFFQ